MNKTYEQGGGIILIAFMEKISTSFQNCILLLSPSTFDKIQNMNENKENENKPCYIALIKVQQNILYLAVSRKAIDLKALLLQFGKQCHRF